MKSLQTKVNFFIWLPTLGLTMALYLKAAEHALWREFAVSEFQLVFAALCLTYFFRQSER